MRVYFELDDWDWDEDDLIHAPNCFFCLFGGDACEFTFLVFGPGTSSLYGAHRACVERHNARVRNEVAGALAGQKE